MALERIPLMQASSFQTILAIEMQRAKWQRDVLSCKQRKLVEMIHTIESRQLQNHSDCL